ncbi:hypothetical protein J6590_005481 [Homalodisca vitripennis]|nr:hypothetical protein J6590_005481 [Homalodisca vitripennis]
MCLVVVAVGPVSCEQYDTRYRSAGLLTEQTDNYQCERHGNGGTGPMDLYDRETHYTRDGITSLPPTMTPLCSTRVSLGLLVVSLLQKIATGGTITCL